jgi:Domain of unknown function (DUF4124)
VAAVAVETRTEDKMKIWQLIPILMAIPVAHAEMWKCVTQDGNTRYTNVRAEAKGCTALNLDPINTVPPPAVPPRAQQKPANFPSVDSDTQKQRDAGRRKILEHELAQEQQQLDAAKKQLSEQKDVRLGSEKNFARVEERLKPFEDRIRLHESNIENLRKELSSVR